MWHEMRHTREERSCPKSIHEYLRVCGVFVKGGQGGPGCPKFLLAPSNHRVLFKVIIAAFDNPGKSSAVSTEMKVYQKLSKHTKLVSAIFLA